MVNTVMGACIFLRFAIFVKLVGGFVRPKGQCLLLVSGGAMTKESITMTHKAVDRLKVIQQVVGKQLRQQEAAWQLGLSVRQLRRLVSRFRSEAAAGAHLLRQTQHFPG